MKSFADLDSVLPIRIIGDHNGIGPIEFRRLLSVNDFVALVDFVDFTVIPPRSTIGIHEHNGNEEAYLIASGNPLVTVEGEQRRLQPGSVAVVRSGQSHGLLNDTDEEVRIFVVQIRIS